MSLTERNLKTALLLAQWGIPSFPCGPDKKPMVKWTKEATLDQAILRGWWSKFPDAIPAIPTGGKSGLAVVDLDIRSGKNGVKSYESLGLDPADAGAVVETAGGGLHLYFSHVSGLKNSQGRLGKGIDVRAEGGYVIAPGAIGPAGAYTLIGGHIDTIQLIGTEPPKVLLQKAHRPHSNVPGGSEVDTSKIREALAFIPSDGSREDWLQILMALHAAYRGGSEGLELAQSWSSDYPGYDPLEVGREWRSFKTDRADGITVGTLFHAARQGGWDAGLNEGGSNASERTPEAIASLNQRYAVVRLGGSAAIADIRESGDIEFLSCKGFRELYANRSYGKIPLGAAWIMHSKRRTYLDGVIFDPSGSVGAGYLNLYRGFAVSQDPAAAFDLIYKHIVEVVASGNQEHADYIFSWLAHIIQKPAEKPGVALVLKGKKGVGKDTLAEIMKGIIGRQHTAHVASTQRLTARFNAAFATALLIHVEEAIWGGHQEAKGTVQSLITCPSLPLERKHIDTVEVDNFSRLLFTTNESWAIPATADERRYAVFEVSAARLGDREYFTALYRQIENGGLAGFMNFLLSWKTPEGLDLRDPPQTKGLMEQKLSGLKGVEAWWYDFLCVGELTTASEMFDSGGGGTEWSDAAQVIARERLRAVYNDWMRQVRFQGDPKGASEFGEALRKLCPDIQSYRPTENGRRVWKYRLPPLEECREAFVHAMGGGLGDVVWDT